MSEENLVKSRSRVRERGEVYTPKHVVEMMIDLISETDWSDPDCVIVEPTCGNGNFVVEIVRRKIASGLSVEQALKTTIGNDIQEDNVLECRSRLIREYGEQFRHIIESNIVVGDVFNLDLSIYATDDDDPSHVPFLIQST